MKTASNFFLFAMLIVGTLFSFLVGWGAYKFETTDIQSRFENDVDNQIADLERELLLNIEMLYSVKSFFDNSEFVSRNEFSQYSRSLRARHQEIQALEWAPKVLLSDREHFIRQARQWQPLFDITELTDDGTVFSAKERESYFPITYLEPVVGNEAAIGFDLTSEPMRANALFLSIDTGKPQVTMGLRLLQEKQNDTGFLVYLPIYHGVPTTLASRRSEIHGVVVGVFRLADIFADLHLHIKQRHIQLALFDVTDASKAQLLYQDNEFNNTHELEGQTISYQKLLSPFGGRQWSISAVPSYEYVASQRTLLPVTAGLLTLLFVMHAAYFTFIIMRKNHALQDAKRRLETLTETDPLTDIANRRCFEKHLAMEWQRAVREQSTLSLLMIDVDHFKRFNDLYGHVLGDDCLRAVAKALANVASRPSDLVARYGGEEFVIILPQTEQASYIANQCLAAVTDLALPHKDSDCSEYISISIGVSSIKPERSSDMAAFVCQADAALYQAKAKGRNQIVFG